MVFRNISFFGEVTETKQVRDNIIWYLRDQLLNLGGYINISSGTLDYTGNDVSKLRASYQPEHNNFQFWKGLSHQWVWESGLNPTYSGGSDPIRPSGVWVNGSFVGSGTASGSYQHYIDFNRGGVIFSGAISSGTDVRCYRTERAAFVYSADSSEFRSLNLEHLRMFSFVPGSGSDAISPEYKVHTPAIFVDTTLDHTIPYELGDVVQFKRFKITFDIAAEDGPMLDFLTDICTNMENLTFSMCDIQDVRDNQDMPLDYKGRLTPDAKVRTTLVSMYPWRQGRFLENSKCTKFPNILPLRRSRVALDFEVVL
jgi:hypothetical protein